MQLFKRKKYSAKFIVEIIDFNKSLFRVQTLYSRAHADKMLLDNVLNNNFLLNNILPEQSCVVGILAGFKRKYLSENLEFFDKVSGVREYSLFRSNVVYILETELELEDLCTTRKLINQLHPVAALYLGFEFGRSLLRKKTNNIIPFLRII